jgi:ASPM-SPD-2-Hydin domain-containing protein
MWLVAAVTITSAPACAFLDKVEKVSKTPGLEEAQLTESLKTTGGPLGQDGVLSPLQATPSVVDFGRVPVASERQKALTVFNPSGFAVTVIRVTVQGCGFALSGQAGDRATIPAQGQLALTVAFQPATRRACSGFLLLEIDSAGGRLTRVPLTGRGV